jgi:hypothetical protein
VIYPPNRRSEDQLIIPPEALAELMNVAGVTPELEEIVSEYLERVAKIIIEAAPRLQSRGVKGRKRALLRRVATLSDELRYAIGELDHEFESHLRDASIIHLGITCDNLRERMQKSLDVLSRASRELATYDVKRVPHRPKGSSQHSCLRVLIYALQQIIERLGGGRLSISQNRDSEIGGTLVAVLNILRPHLPTVVPARNRLPSHPTLVRALREARHREPWGVVQVLSKSYH